MDKILHFDSRILVFGGVYSNFQALQALIAEAGRRGINPRSMICTGDIAAYGVDARACLDMIRRLGIMTIAGNCEEQLGLAEADCGCGYAPGSACDTLSARWFSHAQSEISPDDQQWMSALPLRIKVEINGLVLTVVHGSFNAINRFIFPSTPSRVKAHDLLEAGGDGILSGHSGLPFSQVIDGQLWHNSGALGMPANDGTARVWFSILSSGKSPRTLGSR